MERPTHIILVLHSGKIVTATIAYSYEEAEKIRDENTDSYHTGVVMEVDYSIRNE